MNDIEASDMLFTVDNDTSPTHVATTSDHNNVAGIELNEVGDLVLFDVEFYGVVDPDCRVGVADSSTVVGDDVRDALGTNSHFSNLEKFVASFLRRNAVNGKTAFNVVKETEVFARLFNGDDI